MNILDFELLGRVFSRDQIRSFGRKIHAAGIMVSPEAFAGYLVATSIISVLFLTLVLFLLPSSQEYFFSLTAEMLKSFQVSAFILKFTAFFLIFLVSCIAIFVLYYVLLSAMIVLFIEARKKALESVLPDFLTLLNANVRAGMTLDQAMWYAAKPEFGILSIEVKQVIKDAFSGESLFTALDKLNERFEYKKLERTIALIKQALLSGGEVSEILEMTAADIRETTLLKKDIAATLMIYEIFLAFSATVGAPFLFAVVNKLLSVLEKSFAFSPQITVQTPLFIKPSAPLITSLDFFYFSLVTIFITTLVSAFMIGIVQTGSRNQGLKYFLFMCTSAYIVYFLALAILEAFFANILMG